MPLFESESKCETILMKNNSYENDLEAWFKRRILHAPNQILILVDSNEYVRLI